MADLKKLKLVCIWGHPKSPYASSGRCITCSKTKKHRKVMEPAETAAKKREAVMSHRRRVRNERVEW